MGAMSMPMDTTERTITLNNTELVVITPTDDPVVTDTTLLEHTRWHPASYRIFADTYADAPEDETPADLDMRRGAKLKRIDLTETPSAIVRHKSVTDETATDTASPEERVRR